MEREDEAVLVALIAGIAQGQESALSQFYDRTSRLVYGLALRITGDADAAEEVSSDVYAQVWRTAVQFDPQKGSTTTWLVTMVRTRAIDLIRKRIRIQERETDLAGQELWTCPNPNPESQHVLTEMRSRIKAAMSQLAEDQREVLLATYFAGLTHSEIADVLRLPLGTVKTRIRLGLVNLRRLFETQGMGL
ncbi:MAG: sigma-70 family RNA polymerase sigma factor [Acidobacteria bacterium]|nr:sigma-70 family RNA polymerase sigma factor [Acidobacteriota bacterium]